MRYLLIEVDDTLEDDLMSLEDIACSLADHLSVDIGVIAQVICPVPAKVLKALSENN